MSAAAASGQSSPILKPLVTDQTPLALSNLFQDTVGQINQSHDFVFTSSDGQALFLRRAGAPAVARVVQAGDPVPGVPNSRFGSVGLPILINGAGVVVFGANYNVASGASPRSSSGIFSYDGVSIHALVLSTDPVLGNSGSIGTVVPLGLNDTGDVAFLTTAADTSAVTALFIHPAGASPSRIVGIGDSLPGVAGTVSSLYDLYAPYPYQNALNARGEIVFRCSLSNGGYSILVGSRSAPLRKIAATGDSRPDGGTFTSLSQRVLLNNSGAVAFSDGQIWLSTPGIGPAKVVGDSDPAPSGFGGTMHGLTVNALNDSGQVLFTAQTPNGLFRSEADRSITTIAFLGQTVPGASGGTFQSFGPAVMNNSGDVAFAGFDQSNHQLGVFKQSGADPLKVLVLPGDAAGVGNGILKLNSTPYRATSFSILDDGSVQFSADVAGGPADFVQLLSTATGLQALMSTADVLPAGARTAFAHTLISAAGDYVGFTAELNGGRPTAFIQNVATGTIMAVATTGDPAPGTSGQLRLNTSSRVVVNSQGQAALFASVIGIPKMNSGSLPNGIFLADPVSGLRKIAVVGDTEPTTGLPIGYISNPYTSGPGRHFNSKGQVVFTALLIDYGNWGMAKDSILVGSLNTGIQQVVVSGYQSPNYGAPLINDAGQVAFLSSGKLWIGTPGSTPVKVVAVGDPGPAGRTFSSVSSKLTSFDDKGRLAFSARLDNGVSGVFLGIPSSSPQTIALEGQAVSGDTSSSFGNLFDSAPIANNAGTIVVSAPLTGGSADSGLFLKSGADSKMTPVYLQGQSAPGTSSVFGSVPVSTYNSFLALDNSDYVYMANLLGRPANGELGLFRYRPGGVIEKVLATNEPAPDGAGTIVGFGVDYSLVSKPPFWAAMVGGTISEAIYMPLLPSLQTSTSSLGFTSVDGANPEAQSFTISNAGIGELNWTATASDSWITVDATSGTAPSSVKVSVNAAGLSAGAHHGTITISCGAADGSPRTIDVAVTVLPELSASWPTPAAITYGTPLSGTQLNATASIPGAFVYTPEAGTVLGAGTHTLSATFTPTDKDNYAVVTKTVSLTVNKAAPTIHWSTPVAIASGTALGDAQLNATADVAGAFVYTPAAGTVLDTGSQTLSVRFIPTDTTNYTEATASVSLKVNAPEVLSPAITGLTPALIKAGSSGFNLVVSGSGFGAGATVLWNGSARTTTVVSGGLQAEITAVDIASPGTVNVTVANPSSLGGRGSSQYKFVIDTAAAASGGFTVTVPTTVRVEPGKDTQVPVTLAGVSASATVTATCVNLPTGVSYSYKDGVLTFVTSSSTPRGTYPIVVSFTATTQSAALRRSSNRYFALWLGFGGLPLGLLWAGGRFRRNAARCGIVVGGLLLIAMLASCGGGSTANNQSGTPSTPTAPVSKQSSVVMTLTVR